jgi:hypothetical protein
MTEMFDGKEFFGVAVDYSVGSVSPKEYPRDATAQWAPDWVLRLATGSTLVGLIWFSSAGSASPGPSVPIEPAAIIAAARTTSPEALERSEAPPPLAPDHLAVRADARKVAMFFTRVSDDDQDVEDPDFGF